jgi:DNA (cytosine-5)-methyltransferase 1
MNHIGLFEGIGGFSIAAKEMGWETIAWCEINPFCQTVLKYHFPKAKPHADIKTTDFSIYRGQCDIITGGFPCQPYSLAGKRLGKEDERHLWPEMLRAIRQVRPTWIVGENVFGIVNWNGGMVFEEVCADLEAEGYEVQPFILPAAGVDAPHKRERVWFVAKNTNSPNDGNEKATRDKSIIRHISTASNLDTLSTPNPTSHRRERKRSGFEAKKGLQSGSESTGFMEGRFEGLCSGEVVANSNNIRFDRKTNPSLEEFSKMSKREFNSRYTFANPSGSGCEKQHTTTKSIQPGHGSRLFDEKWAHFPTQPPVCGGDDGLPAKLDGITFSKWRNESIKAYGNAIVPQVVLQIFKAIQEFQNQQKQVS